MNEEKEVSLKKIFGIMLTFIGSFLILIGLLFGSLFQVSGLYFIALGGLCLIVIGVIMIKKAPGPKFFQVPNKVKPHVEAKKIEVVQEPIEQDKSYPQTCPNCGTHIEEILKFCELCGFQLS